MSEEVQVPQEETPKVDADGTPPAHDASVPAEAAEAAEAVEAPVPPETPTVGKRLRAAREAAGLTLESVAQTLKFSARQIELIESDNYAALPGTTIVRGFTRSYARLLKLDAEELLRMLDTRTPVMPADVRPPENMGIADDAAAPRQISLLASTAIVIALAAVLLALWHFFGPATPAGGNGGGERHAAAVPAPAGMAPPASAPAVAGGEAAQPATAATPPAVEALPPPPQLKFVFSGRSWLEVSDAQKQVLHTGENPAGSEVSLSGKPPFDIVVGNAAKVKLTYGEREIDLVPHTRAEVARLKVE